MKKEVLHIRVSVEEKRSIVSAAGGKGNVSKYMLNLHRSRYGIDINDLDRLLHIIFDNDYANKLMRRFKNG